MQLVGLDRPAKVDFQRMLLTKVEIRRCIKESETSSPGFLCLVQRNIGILQQRHTCRATGGIQRYSHTDSHCDVPPGYFERLSEKLGEAPAQLDRPSRLFDVGLQDDQFVPADTCHRVGRAYGATHPVGDFQQQQITGVMPECVVDDLESIKIHWQDGKRPALVCGVSERLSKAIVELCAICETGQRIVIGQMAKTVRGLFPLRDIFHHGHHAGDVALLVTGGGQAVPHPNERTAGTDISFFSNKPGAVYQELFHQGCDRRRVVRMRNVMIG
jgi:hypothetical protein